MGESLYIENEIIIQIKFSYLVSRYENLIRTAVTIHVIKMKKESCPK